jgi:hypothetical protein
MSFKILEVLKGKPTKFIWIIIYVKLLKTYVWDKKIEKQTKLQLIWTYENMVKF